MSRRRSIDIPGLSHGPNPIPQASVVGNLLVSGGVMGVISLKFSVNSVSSTGCCGK